jgi:hypothetical protein
MRNFLLNSNTLRFNMSVQDTLFLVILLQAIECSLAGIKPPDEGTWFEEATDMLYEFCNNSYGLYVKVCNMYSYYSRTRLYRG